MEILKKRILVTVKAYPNPSKKYGETVCCAGVDLDNSQLIRLYPIPFRDLDGAKQFKKYSIIEVNCHRSRNDSRPESFKIDSDSISIQGRLDTDKGSWRRRKETLSQVPVKSMCQVYKDAETDNLSLGLIKPSNISFEYSKRSPSEIETQQSCETQLTFFNKKKDNLEKIPYKFYYLFNCANEVNCPGHKLAIVDWEIVQAYRQWRLDYPDQNVLMEKIEQKWLDISNTQKKDVYFFVGNMKRLKHVFMVLGAFYPKKA